MKNFFNMEADTEFMQESVTDMTVDAKFTDFLDGKFSHIDPAKMVSANSSLKSGFFDMDIESTPDLALGYKNDSPATTPKIGRFF